MNRLTLRWLICSVILRDRFCSLAFRSALLLMLGTSSDAILCDMTPTPPPNMLVDERSAWCHGMWPPIPTDESEDMVDAVSSIAP